MNHWYGEVPNLRLKALLVAWDANGSFAIEAAVKEEASNISSALQQACESSGQRKCK